MPDTRDRADEIIERYLRVPVRMTLMCGGKSSFVLDTVIHRVTRRNEGGLIALDGGAFFVESAMLVEVSPTMLVLRDTERRWSLSVLRWSDLPEEFRPYPRGMWTDPRPEDDDPFAD
ncbi:hypothetical protein Aaci_1069 [Alicyclobacillus acidocaldarius subsp. acidocaldarius DSM 446]|uniref:Uncharacterized protein n=1 Tax=Alicyclobacillus acidocaldarius subsp. acidocaldarius (strain ATCC 27009 / DSM 446 / BCRC 14685 / JCM 5260 / KCTC 1825 / NBRC 15652 / NCIMB 11725 / NRRL B-14509 / 104-IA) TaxID=521098 RepID=C8WVI4_ALIAD|nr:hypothetical protein Aaci_1069 [Alicyclobacillus acidocaldarius subsp. acidocaldarius DSM 446]